MSKKVTLHEALDIFKKAHSLILVSHVSPDGDTLGSTLALAEGLKQTGKKVTIMVDDEIASTYSFMPGVGEYVHPQKGRTYETDLLVIVDASSLDRVGIIAECVKAPILNIDHHVSNTKFADYLWLDDSAAATGEMMFALLKEMQIEITLAMSICLYVAIATDCGFFKYSNTTAASMRAAAELLERGVEPNVVSDFLEMKSHANIELLCKVLNTLTFAENGRIGIIEIRHEDYNKDIDTDSFISYPRYVVGVEVAVMFKAVEPGKTRVSMRSRWIDVSKIALAFNGGGHKKAAGCTIDAELGEAKKQLLVKIHEEMRVIK
jgi:bifunctional oligoribonuclease and PAP phosphatase NrnA